VSNADEEPKDREIDSRCDEWSDPGRNSEPEREVEDVAESQQEGEADDAAHGYSDGLHDGGSVRT
jgi:hypothetical protein